MNAKNLALNLLIKAKDLASDTLDKFQGKVKDSGDQTEQLDDALQNAGKATENFSEQLSAADKAAGRFYDKQGKLRESNGKFVAGAKRAEGATDRLGRKFDSTEDDAKGFTGQLSRLTGKIKGFIAASLAATGLSNLFGNALQSSKTFEKQLDKVAAITSATTEEMALLRDAAEEAGSTTRYTSTQAAEGLEILARAGYSVGESIQLLPTLLNVAAAEEIELSEASQILSDVLSIMGKEARDGAAAADTLAKGASLSATTISQLGLAVSYAGAYTKDFNLDLNDLTALLDVLAKNGLRGERAGVALRSILSQLSDPSSKASRELDKLGISTSNLTAMIDGLRESGEAGTPAVLAFGVEAGPALKALLAEGSEGIAKFTQALNKAEGAAQKMAETASDNLDGSMRGLGSVWDFVRRKLSDPLLKPLTIEARNLTAKLHELTPAFEVFGSIAADILIRVSGGLRLMYNLFTLAAKSIGVFTSQIVVWAADTELALARVLNSVGLVADQTVKALEIQAGGVRAVLDAMKQEAEADVTDIGESFNQLVSGQQAAVSKAVDTQKTLTTAVQETTAAATDARDALADAAEAQQQAAKKQTEAWKTLGLDIAEVTGTVTTQGQKSVEAFTAIAKAGTYSAEQIRLAFNNALSKTTTAADAQALKAALRDLRKEGKITGREYRDLFDSVTDRIKALADETPKATQQVANLKETLAETSQQGSGDISNLTRSMQELSTTVKTLAGDYKAAALEAENLAEKGKGETGDSTRRSSRSRIGARQYYDLNKSGNTEAAARFQELADAYGNTMEGLVLGPKGAAAMEAELNKLMQQAVQQTNAPTSTAAAPTSTSTRTVRIEFAAQGQPSITGDFDESNADQLIRMLSDVGRVAG